MIRRWLFRGPAPAADRALTEREALADLRSAEIEQGLRSQVAYLGALLEARGERVAELEQHLVAERAKVVRLEADLRIARTVGAIPLPWESNHTLRAQHLDGMKTSVVPSALIRKAAKGRHR